MKLTHLVTAAGLAIAALGASAPASAQDMRDHRDDRGYDRRGDDRGYERRGDDRGYDHRGYDHRGYDHRGYDRYDGYRDRGHHYGYDYGRRGRDCRIVYRHHQRLRVCR